MNPKILERDIKFYNIKANGYLNKNILDDINPREKKSLLIEREKLQIKLLDSKCGVSPNKVLTDIKNKKAVQPANVVIEKIIGGK